jgi:hypothetical protein
MNMAGKNDGACSYCDEVLGKAAMGKHVNACHSRIGNKEMGCGEGNHEYLQIAVQSSGSPVQQRPCS